MFAADCGTRLSAGVCWLHFLRQPISLFEAWSVQGTGNPEAEICVSVVIPTHNRPELVVKAVASALGQDFGSLEVIVVVDGEDKRAREVLRKFDDGRLRLIELPASVGGAEARNIGARAARGKWVAFLDDDDEWLPHKLSRQITTARRSNAEWPVISSRMLVRTPKCNLIRPMRRYDPAQSVSEFLFCRRSLKDGPFAMQTSTLMMRRELMLTVPFRSGLKRHQDWDWALRTERVPGVEFVVLDEPLVVYRAEDERESVGRSLEWEFSMEWGKEMRGLFSAKAYSWFLASECATRAVKSRAGWRVYAEILRRFLFDGRPSLGSAVTMAAFLGLPRGWRREVHGLARKWRQRGGTLFSLRRSNASVEAGMES
jgi:glycosyltransferase involved in cell wall biosynthesis